MEISTFSLKIIASIAHLYSLLKKCQNDILRKIWGELSWKGKNGILKEIWGDIPWFLLKIGTKWQFEGNLWWNLLISRARLYKVIISNTFQASIIIFYMLEPQKHKKIYNKLKIEKALMKNNILIFFMPFLPFWNWILER